MICPCKNCTDKRSVGCHSSCQEYIEWKSENDTKNAELRKYKYEQNQLNSFRAEGIRKATRNRRK